MVATPQDINALESFFITLNLPKTLRIYNNAVIYHDLPNFISDNIKKLKEAKITDVVLAPRYADLLEIKRVLLLPTT